MAQRPHQGDDRPRQDERQGRAGVQRVAPAGAIAAAERKQGVEDGDGNSKKDQGIPTTRDFTM